jgi:hypothetical protein
MYGYTYGYPSGGGAGAVNGFESAVLSDGGTVVAIGNTTDLYSRLLGLGLINSASLVNSCNGGKADALYNFIPSPVQSLDRFVVTRASTKLRIGSNGLYGSVANNVPAFEFNTDGTYRGLLVEPGATNLALQSQDFNEAVWVKVISTVTANAGVAPDGTSTADALFPTIVLDQHRVDQTPTSAATSQVFSVFAKSNGYSHIGMRLGTTGAMFNLDTGVASIISGGITASSVFVGNGWYRCVIVKAVGVANETCRINVSDGTAVAANFVGDITKSVLIWQAQLETGSVATSPIVTTAGTANRVADVVSLTGASSLIGQSAGTVFLEVTLANATTASFGRVLEVGSNTTNRISIDANSSTLLGFITTGGVATQGGTMSEASANNVSYKIALAYAVGASQGAFYVNGTGDITSPTAIPASNDVYIGRSSAGANGVVAWYRSVALLPTRLANATLASITA